MLSNSSFQRKCISCRLTKHSKEDWNNYFQVVDEYCSPSRECELTPELLKEIHRKLLPEMHWSGKWKTKRHYRVTEYSSENVTRSVKFQSIAAKKTSFYLKELFKRYNQALVEKKNHPLILIAAFLLDFSQIHPFKDGNGRTGRIICRILLNQQGYTFISYTNFDRYVRSKDAMRSLWVSQDGWHKQQHNPLTWYKVFLRAVFKAKEEFKSEILSKIADEL